MRICSKARSRHKIRLRGCQRYMLIMLCCADATYAVAATYGEALSREALSVRLWRVVRRALERRCLSEKERFPGRGESRIRAF